MPYPANIIFDPSAMERPVILAGACFSSSRLRGVMRKDFPAEPMIVGCILPQVLWSECPEMRHRYQSSKTQYSRLNHISSESHVETAIIWGLHESGIGYAPLAVSRSNLDRRASVGRD